MDPMDLMLAVAAAVRLPFAVIRFCVAHAPNDWEPYLECAGFDTTMARAPKDKGGARVSRP